MERLFIKVILEDQLIIAMKERLEDELFIQECVHYSDEHGIGILDEKTLERCLQLPNTGVLIKHLHYEKRIYPVFANHCFDCYHNQEMIGTYGINNGKVVFVYRDGRTFVTRGYQIIDELCAAGYKNANLYVPFSNGEQIQDIVIKKRWEYLAKLAKIAKYEKAVRC